MIILMFITALALSGVAAFYAIAGLMAIFAAAPVAIAIMGGLLETAKLVVASWVYRNWQRIPFLLKSYFCIAIFILMFLTSMGIFGFLSKSHLDQELPTGNIVAKIETIDDKILTEKEKIDEYRTILAQLDEQVNQTIARTANQRTDWGVRRSVNLRKSQEAERAELRASIEASQEKIQQLTEEKAPLASELRSVEAEVGPVKYIAALIYGDHADKDMLEKAVRGVIILIVIVFDPLAVLMLIAANWSLVHRRDDEPSPQKQNELDTEKSVVSPVLNSSPTQAAEASEVPAYLKNPWSWIPTKTHVAEETWQTPPPPSDENWISRPHKIKR